MDRITIKDKTFRVSMTEAEIKQRVRELAQQMSRELEGKNPLFLAVLNGAFWPPIKAPRRREPSTR